MTERGLPLADGASACPFVAFEDDRDERASVPDHRHRCYAETRPAPRALAHQEAYCLSSAFPVCPTFQDWARREAARARGVADAAAASAGAAAIAAAAAGSGAADEAAMPAEEPARLAPAADPAHEPSDSDEFGARRNPPRDWAAPPPWLASAEGGVGRHDSDPPPFLSHRASEPGQGLAGSAADRLAGGPPPSADIGAGGGAGIAGATGAAAAAAAGSSAAAGRDRADPHDRLRAADDDDSFEDLDRDRDDAPPHRAARRPRAYEQHLGGTDGPDWERPRRYEAYPTIRTRMALPNMSRIAVMAGAIAIAAVALFFLPAILGIGGAGTPPASVRPSVARTASLAPTDPPAPTAALYTIKKGETLLKIATAHGVTLEELLAANPQIKNKDRIAEGQQITIPAPSEGPGAGGSSPETSAAP